MDKIDWCFKKGLRIVEPSENLKEAYISKAKKALEESSNVKSDEWKITSLYYCIYFSLYSLLAQIGMKSEIHSCTIEVIKRYFSSHFEEDVGLIENALKARNDFQYYFGKEVNEDLKNEFLENAPKIYTKCKNISLSENEIKEIRKELENHNRK